jgi:hypothetical protein
MLRKHAKKAVLILQTLKVDRARKGEEERCVAQSGSGRRLLCCKKKKQRLF